MKKHARIRRLALKSGAQRAWETRVKAGQSKAAGGVAYSQKERARHAATRHPRSKQRERGRSNDSQFHAFVAEADRRISSPHAQDIGAAPKRAQAP